MQAYEGVCIGRSGGGLNESFTVRKISYGEGVERVFPVMSPMIDSIKVVRHGKVRRAKLYYLRGLRGKKARITENVEFYSTLRTERALQSCDVAVLLVDAERGLILVKGSVPGPKGSLVVLRTAAKKGAAE